MQRDVAGQFESLADQFVAQLRDGDSPSIEEYAAAHPELADRIRRLFPVMELMESGAAESIDDEELLRTELEQLSSLPPLRKLGEYQIVREIGRGGMGVVYLARQESLGRYVALKLLPESAGFDERRYKRFQQEARASGMLVHANIVPVFGIGRSDDVSYFVMQYIDGTSLDKVIKELRTLRDSNRGLDGALDDTAKSLETSVGDAAWEMLSTPHDTPAQGLPPAQVAAEKFRGATSESTSSAHALSNASRSQASALSNRNQYFRNVARIGMQISDALQHAHNHKILHRDIKPANLLLDKDGHAWVTDFGLAKLLDEANLTRTGETVGTLRYLPPEQFDGISDVRSDVYSLGLTLYELLALKPAFDGEDFAKLLHNVTDSDPVSPRKLDPRIPRDLATIVMKAIARKPEHRYQTAAALHDDLGLFLEGKPIQAKQASEIDRLWKAMKRRPVVSTLSVLLLAALLVGSALVTWKWQEAARSLEIAENEAATRKEINDFLFQDLLNYARPELEPDPDIKLRVVFDRASQKIEQRFGTRPLIEADIRVRIGKIYLGLSKFEASKVQFERAFHLYAENLGLEDARTDQAYFNLALAEHGLGNFRQSLEMLNEVYKFRVNLFGPRSVSAMSVKPELADVSKSLGWFREAKTEIEDYISYAEITNAVRDSLGQSRLKQAQILVELAEYDEAEKVLTALIPTVEHPWHNEDGSLELSGEMMRDFYTYLSARNSQAAIFEYQGYPLKAIEIHGNNFETATELLGPEHATTLKYAANLARALVNSEKTADAEQLLKQQIPISEKSRGVEHPQTLDLKNTMAILLFENGDSESAEAIMTEVRNHVVHNYGQEHPNSVRYNFTIAAVYYRTKQFEKAEVLMKEVVERSRRILGEEHPQTIVALADLAATHGRLGNDELAEQEFNEALAASRKRMRPNHPELLATIMSFSLFNELRGRFDLAEPLLEEWLDGLIETCGLNDSSTILAKNSLAIAYEKQNKLDQALPLYSDCYQYHRSISGPCAYKTYNVLFPLTECEYKLGNHQASISRLEQFCESCKLEDGENSFQYARAQNRLGRAYSRIGDLDKAETVLLDGYDQLSAADGVDDESIRVVELRNAASRLAGVYQELKNTEAFEFWRDRHRQWSIKVQQGVVQDNVQAIGNDHPQTVSAKRELAELLVKADKDSEAWPIMMELFEHFQEKDGFAAESTFDILIRLAIVDHALKQFSESDARLQNYLDQTRDEPGFHWQRAKAKSYLGRAKIELGEYEAAESTLLAAFEAFQQLEADADPVLWRPEMRKVANRLMELYRRMENDDERAAWREKYRFYKQKPELDD